MEVQNLKQYSELLDKRFNVICQAEEQANMKVLKLLEEISELTVENQNLLEIHQRLTCIPGNDTSNSKEIISSMNNSREEFLKVCGVSSEAPNFND